MSCLAPRQTRVHLRICSNYCSLHTLTHACLASWQIQIPLLQLRHTYTHVPSVTKDLNLLASISPHPPCSTEQYKVHVRAAGVCTYSCTCRSPAWIDLRGTIRGAPMSLFFVFVGAHTHTHGYSFSYRWSHIAEEGGGGQDLSTSCLEGTPSFCIACQCV